MAFSKSPNTASGLKPKNKLRRQAAFLSIKKARESEKRDSKLRRKREEEKDPSLREARLAVNKPTTIEGKRVWDNPVGDEEDALGWAIDVEQLQKLEAEKQAEREDEEQGVLAKLKARDEAATDDEEVDEEMDDVTDEDADSMLDSDSDDSDSDAAPSRKRKRDSSPSVTSTAATQLNPDFLKKKFPQLFSENPVTEPRILITTSINASIHKEAETLTSLFPNSTYIRRSRNFKSHKYSVKEIAAFVSKNSLHAPATPSSGSLGRVS
jgi:ribosome production factor 1